MFKHFKQQNASIAMQWKACQPYLNSDSIFTTSQKYIFNVHHFRRKIQHIFGEGTDKKADQNSPKQHFR